jgi:hypothetical protein
MRSAENTLSERSRSAGPIPACCRIEQNLGILATIRGDHAAAPGTTEPHWRLAGHGRRQGLRYRLSQSGMISADRKQWADAGARAEPHPG